MLEKGEALKKANLYFRARELYPPRKVKTPIYKTKWKLNLLKIIIRFYTFFRKLRGKVVYIHPNVSIVDFSKWVKPDSWKTTHSGYIAYDCEESKLVWKILFTNGFYLEDLTFGMKPISAFLDQSGGLGEILVDKTNGHLIITGSLSPSYTDEDYQKFKSGRTSKVNWDEFIKK
ncbi:MAG: hypothetical protein GY810_10405 [Aureispira sp.]|nr:hypothetical protein [Aureispira sp.]